MTPFVGFVALYRHAMRLERIQLPVWIAVLVLTVQSTVASFRTLYPTPSARAGFARSIVGSAVYRALVGPPFDLSTLGGLTAWRLGSLAGILVALMSILSVVRHTRADEEAGRAELIGAGVVGRQAPVTAALAVAGTANVLLALLVGGGLAADGIGAAGSIALGAAIGSLGCLFAGFAAVISQLTSSARTARSVALTTVGAAFVLRAAGDSAPSTSPAIRGLTWLSPIAWAQQVRPFAGDRWWVIALLLGVSILLAGLALRLNGRRDLGAGLFPVRPGPERARPGLSGAFGLAWRLHRGPLIGWTIGFALVGAVFGLLAKSAGQLLDENADLKALLVRAGGTSSVIDAYLAAMFGLLGVVAAAFAVQAMLRLRSEEAEQRMEPILATAASRNRAAGSHLVFAVGGPAVLLVAAGTACGVIRGLEVHDLAGQTARLLSAGLAPLPAVWLFAGWSMALVGMRPRWSALAWGYLGLCLLITELGAGLNLSRWLLDVSPFSHVPSQPGGAVKVVPIVLVLLCGAGLTSAGFAGFRRRDIG